MYAPDWVAPERPEDAFELITRNPFGVLIGADRTGFEATHLPFLLDSRVLLSGHMARANPQWRRLELDGRVLAIFQSPGSYISPSWYRDEPDVPTWNYAAVHVHGRFRIVGAERAAEILERTVARFEAGRPTPWRLASLPPNFVADLARGIVAFEIDIERVEAAFKLSQDKTEDDRGRVEAQLKAAGGDGGAALAGLMQAARSRR